MTVVGYHTKVVTVCRPKCWLYFRWLNNAISQEITTVQKRRI